MNRNEVKVLHLITGFSLGGATENTLLSVEGLQNLGYDVSIATGPAIPSEGDLFDRAQQQHVTVTVLPVLQRRIHPLLDIQALARIWRLLRERRYHIVHTHSSKAGFLGRVAAKLAGVPVIVHTIHGLPFHDYLSPLAGALYIMAERFGARMSDKVVAVTDTIVRKCLAAKVGKRDQFVTIRSGFEMDRFLNPQENPAALRQQLGIRDGDLVVGKIARISPLKGHDYLLGAIPRVVGAFPRVRFLLVGGGDLEEEFRGRVRREGLEDAVIFAGRVDNERIASFLSVMDVVVHTSLREGLARVIPQALAVGKPVVSFDIDGSHEVVLDGKTGILVKPCDVDALAKAICSLLEDPERARRMGRNGVGMVRHAWTTQAMVQAIDEVYVTLLQKKLGVTLDPVQ